MVSGKAFTATQSFAGFAALVAAGDVPANAVLTDVHDTLSDTLQGTVAVHNTSTTSGVFTATALDKAVKTFGASGFSVTTVTTGNAFAGTLAGGASTSGASNGTNSNHNTSTNAAVLAFFEGTTVADTIADSIGTLASINFSGKVTSIGLGSVTDTLSYSYSFKTGTTPIPEPVTLSVLGTGLVGLAIARRRKRRTTS